MNHRKALIWVVVLSQWFGYPPLLHAQENTPDPLVMSFSSLPPFMQTDAPGKRSGFSVELAEMIGAEIGVPVEFLDVQTVRDVVAAQVSGRGQFFAGVLQLPALSQTNVFSDPVASERLLVTVLEKNRNRFGSNQIQGLRIGTVAALGALEPILADNIPVEFVNAETALIALFSGFVDALLVPPATLYRMALGAGIDGHLAFVGEPLRETTRHVALHKSRAALLGPINKAIARLEADGRLQALRQSYGINVPPPPPDVLKVGITQLPPLSIIGDNDAHSGFNVEVVRALAKRAGLDIQFVPLPLAEWVKGPTFNSVDLISALVITPERLAEMDFSYPILERKVAAVFPEADTSEPTKIADLSGRKVGTIEGSIFALRANAIDTLEVVGFETNQDVISALLAGELDVAILAPNVVQDVILGAQAEEQLRIVQLIDENIDTGLALRPGLGAVRERLNAVTPGYLLSNEYVALRQKYLGAKVFWTQNRLYAAFGVAVAGFFVLLGSLFWQRQRQRQITFLHQQSELEREQAHIESLGKVITELERSNRELDEFAYTASHDLKEPLRGIAINANFLAREQLSEKGEGRVERMLLLATRMEQLVSDLLFFSRLGRGEKVMKNVDTVQIIEGIQKELKEWMTERRGDIQWPANLPWTHAERSKVKTVFQNLIVNGLKYNDADIKTVEVGFSAEVSIAGTAFRDVFWVRDNGIGISEQNREKVFRIFQRLNREEAYGPGTGAGLSFVRKIIEEYGGSITFESVPDRGTTFYFSIPLAEAGNHSKAA